jgi:uncharacterized protein
VKHAPTRTCLGCRTARPKGALVRLVRREDGRVVVDASGPGRGAYVCAERGCVERALKTGRLSHAFRAPCRVDEGLERTVLAGAPAAAGQDIGEDRLGSSRDATAPPDGPSVEGHGAMSRPSASTRR